MCLRQGQVEVTDDISVEDKLIVEVVKRAGSIEELKEISVGHDELISDNRLTVAIRVVSTVLYSRKTTPNVSKF